MELSKGRAISAVLAAPAYDWIKAVCAARLDWHFLPATDVFFHIVFAAFGLMPKKDAPPPAAP